MKRIYWLHFGLILVLTGFVLSNTLLAQQPKPKPLPRTCAGYQSDKCECDPKKKCATCACNPCTADNKCACLTALRASAGTVKGEIKVVKTKVKTKGSKSQKEVIVFLEQVVPEGVNKTVYPVPCKHPSMDQKGLVFLPHIMAVQKGTTVDFLNSDNVAHNIFCMDDCCKILEEEKGKKPKFMDLGNWGKGEVRTYTFNLMGEAVLLCKLHPEMAAYVLVVETPFFTVTEIEEKSQAAEYVIKNVPPGQYLLNIWNKKCDAEIQKVTVKKGEATEANVELQRRKRRR